MHSQVSTAILNTGTNTLAIKMTAATGYEPVVHMKIMPSMTVEYERLPIVSVTIMGMTLACTYMMQAAMRNATQLLMPASPRISPWSRTSGTF